MGFYYRKMWVFKKSQLIFHLDTGPGAFLGFLIGGIGSSHITLALDFLFWDLSLTYTFYRYDDDRDYGAKAEIP
jgi:hypothetical protein